MEKSSLTALARTQLTLAEQASSGRSAHTVVGGHEHVLRQTLIALTAGTSLADHENPGEATIHVLHGRIRLVNADTSWDGSPGDLLIVPNARHSLEAIEASAVLLAHRRQTLTPPHRVHQGRPGGRRPAFGVAIRLGGSSSRRGVPERVGDAVPPVREHPPSGCCPGANPDA